MAGGHLTPFGKVVTAALRRHHLYQKDLADYCHRSKGTVSRWMRGKARPSDQDLRVISLDLHLSYEHLQRLRERSHPPTDN